MLAHGYEVRKLGPMAVGKASLALDGIHRRSTTCGRKYSLDMFTSESGICQCRCQILEARCFDFCNPTICCLEQEIGAEGQQ